MTIVDKSGSNEPGRREREKIEDDAERKKKKNWRSRGVGSKLNANMKLPKRSKRD